MIPEEEQQPVDWEKLNAFILNENWDDYRREVDEE